MKKLLSLALAINLAIAAPAFAQTAQRIDRIAAVVNEDVILKSELDQAVGNILSQYASRQNELPPRDVLERQVLERLIMIRLQVARAQQSGIKVDDAEIDQAVGAIAQQNKLTVEQLQQSVVQQGSTYAAFRASLADELAVQHLKQAYAQSSIHVSDSEVNAALASQAQAGPQLHLANIVVALPAGATPEQIAEAQKKIEDIKGKLDRGEIDFQAAAIRYSNGPNALEGGDLGWRSTQEIPPAFTQLLQGSAAGQVIGPIRGTTGFQLVKLLETRTAAAGASTVSQYQVRELLVKSADAANDKAARAKADTLAARIKGGADFAKLARAESDDPSKARGGDIGWRTQDALGADLGAAVAALPDGQVTAPVATPEGWVLMQRVATRQGVAASDDQRAQVRDAIGRRKLEDAYDRFLREMRGEAYVEVRNDDGSPASISTPQAAPSATPAGNPPSAPDHTPVPPRPGTTSEAPQPAGQLQVPRHTH